MTDEPSSQPAGTRTGGTGAFGPNAWLVDDMYERFQADPSSVGESWREFFADYRPSRSAAPPLAGLEAAPSPPAGAAGAVDLLAAPAPSGVTTTIAPAGAVPATGPVKVPATDGSGTPGATQLPAPTPLRGAAARIAVNMEASLSVPTATSVRTVPAKLLEVNRTVLNNQLGRTTGGKVSFTHLIGFAVVRALQAVPALNATFVEGDGGGPPGVLRHKHVGLGLAVDVEKADGSRTLLVPCIRDADTLDFRSFVAAYEDLVRKVHGGKAAPDDFAGTTVTLTNPGTLGTVQSVPRLMPGQGAIIGVGALGYPAEFQAADPRALAHLGLGKVVTLTSTYDHRIIQGAESGLFLAYVAECLMGGHDFYEDVFAAMDVPYRPVQWHDDVNPADDSLDERMVKQVRVQSLINMYRVRGHLIAHLDPLDAVAPQMHPELDPLTYGLTIWDLPRRFVADGLAGRDAATLDEILDILRDAYCRTLGVEYMHIQDPEQKRWIQEHVEGVSTALSPAEQHHILDRLNAAEVFERFLHTRYVGQKRFGLEGAESAIVVLDALLDDAASAGVSAAVMGMAHRGRLNVLSNIVGKSYRELFREFEGDLDPESVQGSGDVKYHKGAGGTFTGRSGHSIELSLASNPSHLEAVDPVVVGMARAKQDRLNAGLETPEPSTPPARLRHGPEGVWGEPDSGRRGVYPVLSLLIHGDAAFAGQGVVAETLNLSGLVGYRTGGTIHLVINNQLGFTTAPESARTSEYPTDVAKMVQAPIFHVNGDDPEACVRAARLAFAFRQEFRKDVVIDMVCYRRHGHNEGDDPSYTQPLMYALIDAKRSVRKQYTETLIRRGDLTLEDAERALDDFSARLQAALDETRAEGDGAPTEVPPPPPAVEHLPVVPTGVDRQVLERLAAAVRSVPDGFTLHPKLVRQFAQRDQLVAGGQVDWALGEALAIGSLLLEGTDVRLTGQDTRRGTFSQRHAVLVDHETGAEWVPLAHLDELVGAELAAGMLDALDAADHPDHVDPTAMVGVEGLVGEAGQVGDAGLGGTRRHRTGWLTVRDSLLSEYAAVGFEYGYSVEAPGALVAWEAQFGDFANGASIIIDNFLVAAEDKWGQRSGLVLLLPHGYEGQGPEHSSARIERFLTLCARGNLRVVQPTTAAQYFHLLRAQIRGAARRPLVVFTPKSLLRAPASRSHLEELAVGSFAEILDDPRFGGVGLAGAGLPVAPAVDAAAAAGTAGGDALPPGGVRRVLLCNGKIAVDVSARRDEEGREDVAVIRVEQLYPWPGESITAALARYPDASEVVWLQDEPENMGAWSFVHGRLHRLLRDDRVLTHVSRPESASPATGSAALHALELQDLLARALG